MLYGILFHLLVAAWTLSDSRNLFWTGSYSLWYHQCLWLVWHIQGAWQMLNAGMKNETRKAKWYGPLWNRKVSYSSFCRREAFISRGSEASSDPVGRSHLDSPQTKCLQHYFQDLALTFRIGHTRQPAEGTHFFSKNTILGKRKYILLF